ncbi:MAG: LeuA family protein [Aigarchaeota archaeon]|nr:LeuA family protein [Aigarchaeota archaeon]MCX8192342.1 LeuA family protein [Nitrososphaeria archaeon]MDW7986866.1 LeuA family protein [Nitrososphaerota archaeon]
MRTCLLDTTLREGELYRLLKLSRKIAIARSLLEVGIRRIELTLAYPPRTSPEDLKMLISLLNDYDAESVIHCRAYREDVESASKYDVWGIAVYIALSKIHARYKFGEEDRGELTRRLIDAIELSKESGFKYIRATIEDASRIYLEEGLDELVKTINVLRDAGATIISLPDTSGLMTPPIVRDFIKDLKRCVSAQISAHFHNDYGYASANTVEAILAGVDEAHVSILGIGDRNGIADLYEVVAPLIDIHRVELGVKRESLKDLYSTFSKLTGIRIPARHPLSDEARTIRAGVHQSMTIKAPEGYIPKGKLHHDFTSILYEPTPFISKRLIEEILGECNLSHEKIKELTERIGSEASRMSGRLPITRLQHILSEYLSPTARKKLEKFFGLERAYVLLKSGPSLSIDSFIEEVSRWSEVEHIEEVYGCFDLILTVKTNPGIEEFVEKLNKLFGNGIEKISILTLR